MQHETTTRKFLVLLAVGLVLGVGAVVTVAEPAEALVVYARCGPGEPGNGCTIIACERGIGLCDDGS